MAQKKKPASKARADAREIKFRKPEPRIRVRKRTSIGNGTPLNKHKRRQWKAYRGQGR